MIEAPKQPVKPSLLDHEFKDELRSSKMTAFFEALEHGHATAGATVGVWSWGDTPFETTSAAYTSSNDVDGADLDDLNPVVHPRRPEIGGLDASSTRYYYVLEVQVFGQNVSLKADWHRRESDDQVASAATDSVELTCGSSPEWSCGYVLLSDDGVALGASDHLGQFSAKTTATTARVWQLSVREVWYVNVAYEQLGAGGLSVYGSEWIGMYADGADIDAWDADGAPLELGQGTQSYRPHMRRDVLGQDLAAAEFTASAFHRLVTGSTFALSGDVVLAAVLLVNDTTTRTALEKENGTGVAIRIEASGGYIVAYVESGGTIHTAFAAYAAGALRDAIAWWDATAQTLYLLVDGEIVASKAVGAAMDTGAGHAYAGASAPGNSQNWDGQLALPHIASGTITRRDVYDLMAWRRHIHGIY